MKKYIIFPIINFTFTFLLLTFSYSDTLTVASDTFLNAGHYVYDAVIVNAGCTLLCKSNTAYNTGVVITCQTMTINGTVSSESQGYPQGQGPGTPTAGTISGATYGGYGGGHGIMPPDPYGSVTCPSDLGSGGNYGASGSGGGIIVLKVSDQFVINGLLSSRGGDGANPGGSGGSVLVFTKGLSGAGRIIADGGNSGGAWGGTGGGGGRIAIYYETMAFNSDSMSARRGTTANGQAYTYGYGGQGTIFLKSSGQQNGTLIIDQKTDYYRPLNPKIKGNYDFDTVILKGSVEFASGYSLNAVNIVSDSPVFTIRCDGELNKISDLVVNDSVVLEANYPMTLNNLTIKRNGKLSHTANYDSQKRYWLSITVNNNAVIDSGGSIDVSSKGYANNTGPGRPKSLYAGGSHGGKGVGYSGGIPGDTYGSDTQPYDLGSGGYGGENSPGGGLVYLLVWGTLTVNGSIFAVGGQGCGSGSGGSIYIKSPTIMGDSSGVISVKGGPSDGHGGSGRGAGGRIAVYYDTYDYKGQYLYSGGPAAGTETGTLYVSETAFHLAPGVPTIDNPSYSGPIPGKRPTFKWTAPRDEENDNLHFEIQITQDSSFSATPSVDAFSSDSIAGFAYSSDNGINWQVFPSTGVVSSNNPEIKASYTVQTDLSTGYWYWRVRAKDVDGFSSWSELGYLPSIVGDLVVRITSPADSIAVYEDTIIVEGKIENSTARTLTVNGTAKEFSLSSDGKFSVEINLEIGKNEIIITGNGPIGNYIADTVTVHRLKIPSASGESKIGKDGGTVRLEDWDNDTENDARIEIEQGVLDREIDFSIKYVETQSAVTGNDLFNVPYYEIKAGNNASYRFKKKIKIVLSYKNMKFSDSEETKLRVFVWDGVKWQFVGGEVNKTKCVVVTWTDHLSKYAVMVLPEEKETQISVSPEIFTPNGDGINDLAIFNILTKSPGKCEIRIYNDSGKAVRVITDDIVTTGMSVSWDGRDSAGKLCETGTYIYNVVLSAKTISTGAIVIAK